MNERKIELYKALLETDLSMSDAQEIIAEKTSTEKAYETLQAIMGALEKQKNYKDNDVYKMARDIYDYYTKNDSFSPKQAEWIWKTSDALFNKK